MAPPNNNSGLNTFLAFVGVMLSLVSLAVAYLGDRASPYVTAGFVVMAVAAAFVAGYNLNAALAHVGGFIDRRLEKAVDSKMAEIEALVDERISECFRMDGSTLYIETPSQRREKEAE